MIGEKHAVLNAIQQKRSVGLSHLVSRCGGRQSSSQAPFGLRTPRLRKRSLAL